MGLNLAQDVDGGPLGGPDGGPDGGPLGGPVVGRFEDLKAVRMEALTADRSGALMVARTVVQMADHLEVRMEALTADRSVGQWEGRMEALTADRLGGPKEEQMEEWPEGLAPRRQERVSAGLQVRSQAPLASA